MVFKIRVDGDLGRNVPMFILQITKFSEKKGLSKLKDQSMQGQSWTPTLLILVLYFLIIFQVSLNAA